MKGIERDVVSCLYEIVSSWSADPFFSLSLSADQEDTILKTTELLFDWGRLLCLPVAAAVFSLSTFLPASLFSLFGPGERLTAHRSFSFQLLPCPLIGRLFGLFISRPIKGQGRSWTEGTRARTLSTFPIDWFIGRSKKRRKQPADEPIDGKG